MSFPLYDSLLAEVGSDELKDLTTKQKNESAQKIKQFDTEGYSLCYALIRSYQTKENDNIVSFELPYESKQLKTGIKFELDKLPIKLKHIILKFIDKHLTKMEEEKKLIKVRHKK